jgi:hypothetical protein
MTRDTNTRCRASNDRDAFNGQDDLDVGYNVIYMDVA